MMAFGIMSISGRKEAEEDRRAGYAKGLEQGKQKSSQALERRKTLQNSCCITC